MDIHAFPWWRFDRYEVRDGYVMPASNARGPTRFDLWSEDAGNGASRVRDPAYLKLANVPDSDRDSEFPPPTESERWRIVEWSARYGPTGVLLQRTAEVALPQGTLHRWVGDGWLSQTTSAKPHAVLRKLDPSIGWDDSLRSEALTDTWWRFFPLLWADLHAWDPHLLVSQKPLGREAEAMLSRDWPEPGTKQFHASYRESVPDFMAAALAFRKALDWAKQGLAAHLSVEDRIRAFIQINHLQATARQALSPHSREGQASLRWSAPSALAALAVLAANDIAAGHDFGFCARASCKRMFRVVRTSTRYCSRPCLAAEKQRAYRERVIERVTARRGSRTALPTVDDREAD